MQLAPAKPTQWRFLLLVVIGMAGVASLYLGRSGQALPEGYRYKYPDLLGVRKKVRTGAYQQEIAFYQARIQNNPGDGLDLAALAGTYLKRARVTGQGTWYLLAEQAAQRSLAALPVYNSGARLSLAEVAQARHDFGTALGLIAQVLAAEPRNTSAISLRATVYLALGRLSEAARDADRLASGSPNPTNLTLRALIREAQGQDTQALADFSQALRLEEPDDPFGSARVRTLLGRYYARHGELDLAAGLYREALRIAPNYPQATLLLADLESRRGHYRAAEAGYNSLLGAHAAQGNQSQGSGSVYDHAAMRGLARIKRVTGSPGEADYWDRTERILRFEVQSGAFGHRRELARMLLERGRPQDVPEALALARLEAKSRRDWETLGTLAWAQAKSQQWPQAKQTMQEALASGIRDAELFYRAAQIEQALGHVHRAEEYLARSRQTDPGFGATLKLLGLE